MKFRWYIWIPRVLLIIVTLFMALFSLDVFGMQVSFGQKMLRMLMHNIPTIVLLLVLFLTWKRPFWGGIFFLILGIALSVAFYIYFRHFFGFDFLVFGFPVLVCSVLFFLAHFNRPKAPYIEPTPEEILPFEVQPEEIPPIA